MLGAETYDNQVKYGKDVFEELMYLQEHGFKFEGVHHDIKIICCCDWKVGACIEGKVSKVNTVFLNHTNI